MKDPTTRDDLGAGDTDIDCDVSICVRCLLSDGWPRRLAESDPATRDLACQTLRTHFLEGGLPLAKASCLAGRGIGLFAWKKSPTSGQMFPAPVPWPGSVVFPWSGSFVEPIPSRPPFLRPMCSDFTDAKPFSDNGENDGEETDK